MLTALPAAPLKETTELSVEVKAVVTGMVDVTATAVDDDAATTLWVTDVGVLTGNIVTEEVVFETTTGSVVCAIEI